MDTATRIKTGELPSCLSRPDYKRELTMCRVDGCVLVVDHSGEHYTQAHHGAGDCSDVIRHRLARDQRDRYAAVVELVPAMVEEIEELRCAIALKDGAA